MMTKLSSWALASLATMVVMFGAANHSFSDEIVTKSDETPATHVVSYLVKDLLAMLQDKQGLSKSEAEVDLKEWLLRDPRVGPSDLKLEPKQVTWSDGKMTVNATDAVHNQIVKALAMTRKFGISEIAIGVHVVSVDTNRFDDPKMGIPSDWATVSVNVPDPTPLERPLADHPGTSMIPVKSVVQTDSPVRYRIVDKEQADKLLQGGVGDKRTNVLQNLKVTLFNGSAITLADVSKTPFFVGLKEDKDKTIQPQIRVVPEGTTLQLRPTEGHDGIIHVDFSAVFSKVEKVEIENGRPFTDPRNVQIPTLASTRMEGGADLKPGQCLMVRGYKKEINEDRGDATAVSWSDWLLAKTMPASKPYTAEIVLTLSAERVCAGPFSTE